VRLGGEIILPPKCSNRLTPIKVYFKLPSYCNKAGLFRSPELAQGEL
jgi:hypothetical protein